MNCGGRVLSSQSASGCNYLYLNTAAVTSCSPCTQPLVIESWFEKSNEFTNVRINSTSNNIKSLPLNPLPNIRFRIIELYLKIWLSLCFTWHCFLIYRVYYLEEWSYLSYKILSLRLWKDPGEDPGILTVTASQASAPVTAWSHKIHCQTLPRNPSYRFCS